LSNLAIQFLGDFEVRKDGETLPLPPSKKTRALLAYLCLNDRRFRREQLCELLWEIPDDPRGSLRWSLSKLRRLVDGDTRRRVIADRLHVEIDAGDITIDVVELHRLAANGLADLDVDALERAAARFVGNFLEGLEFSEFHDFHAWCVAEREQAIGDRIAVLTELVQRLDADPARAVPHARSLVGLSPYEERYRAVLIRLLMAEHKNAEAERQYQLGMRVLAEAGIASGGAMKSALASSRPSAEAVAPEPAWQPRTPVAQTPGLVGREQELALLLNALGALGPDGTAAAWLVRGEPGIGKSRVVDALLGAARAGDVFVLQATAFESDSIRPYALWTDALRSLGDSQYDRVFGDSGNDNRDRLFAELSELIGREAERRPVVIVFDDVHWCDESSASALHYVMRMNRNKPVLAVLAARGGELRDNAPVQQCLRGIRRDGLLNEQRLGPLSEPALAELIARHAPDVDNERLSRECGGNPLLAIELARSESEGSGGGSLEDLVSERLERLSVAGAELLRWASILIPPVDMPALAEITGIDPTEIGRIVEQAECQGMLVPADSGFRFSHNLIGKAVYTEISPLRRQVMHRRVAELLEPVLSNDLTKASWLAHHATQSGDAGLAARSMVLAGKLSLRYFANDDAVSLARKGLQFAETLGDAERATVEVELHEILLAAAPLGDWEAMAELYASLAERALDHGALSHARLGYHMAAYVRWTQGEWEAARRQSLKSERVLRGDDSRAHIVGLAETAKCLVMLERDLTQADAMVMEASALAGRRQFAHQALPAAAGMLELHRNRLDEAEELFLESRMLCKSAGDRLNEFLASEYLVIIALQRGDYDTARQRARDLATLGDRIREGSEKPFADALLALVVYAADDDAGGLDEPLEALRIVDAKYRLAFVLSRAALIDCERGRGELAVARASEALECAKILERPTEMLLAHAVLACGYAGIDTDEAREHAAAVDALQPDAATWTGGIALELAQRKQATNP